MRKSDLLLRGTVADPDGLLDWKSADRAILAFADEATVRNRAGAARAILRDSIAGTQ